MAIPQDAQARRYYRVAYQRLDDGQLILEELDRPNTAIYITGYAVECILKALLLTIVPVKTRKEALASFRGGMAHNLDWLNGRLKASGAVMPSPVAREMAYLEVWTTDLRYDPSEGDSKEARRFIRAAQNVLVWADERM